MNRPSVFFLLFVFSLSAAAVDRRDPIDLDLIGGGLKETVTIGTLRRFHNDCHVQGLTSVPEYSKGCIAAAHRYCRARGLGAGLLQEVAPPIAVVVCAAAESRTVAARRLQAFHPNCTPRGLLSTAGYDKACSAAANRLCGRRTGLGGVLQEFDGRVAVVACFLDGDNIPVRVGELYQQHQGCHPGDLTGTAGYSKSCLAASHRLCAAHGYAGGQPVEILLPDLVVACTY